MMKSRFSAKVIAVTFSVLGTLLAGCDVPISWGPPADAPSDAPVWTPPAATPRPAATPTLSTPAVAATPSPPSTSPPTATTTPGGSTVPPSTTHPVPSAGSPTPSPISAGGKPGPSNTGVQPGTQLSVISGDQVFSVDNQVITGKDFHGFVTVRGRNVRFQNCIFRGGIASGNGALLDAENAVGTVVEDSEFVAAHPSATINGIWANNTQIFRSNIHGGVDGVKTGSNVTVQDSWIHDMNWFASDPNQRGGETHNDGVQSFDGAHSVFLRHNNIDMSTTYHANAAWQSSATDAHVEGNWLDGGGCSLNFAHIEPKSLTGIYVVNNRFGRNQFYHCGILVSTKTTLTENSGNIWDDTGDPIPPPDRHD
jgi:hypothetical protein